VEQRFTLLLGTMVHACCSSNVCVCQFIALHGSCWYPILYLSFQIDEQSEAIVRAWSMERGAGSGDFESGEQELTSKF
jgi:hypothetical protein